MRSTTEHLENMYSKLRKMIVTKKLAPGFKINKASLAQEFLASSDVVDLALEKLKKENFVVTMPDNNLHVREMSTVEMIEILDCRIALETKAVKLFTKRASQDKIDDLRNLMAPFENGPKSIHVFQKIDRHFHEVIVNNCGNNTLKKLFDIGKFWDAMELTGISRSLNDVLKEHLDIITAIHKRDHKKATMLMRLHLEQCKISIL